MADLKHGSTVGGSPIWTQGNLTIQPAGDQLFYKGHKIYTAFDKPSATDFDSVSAKDGGTFQKQVHFEEGLSVGSASAGETKKNGIFKGKSDAANFDGVSWGLHSWKSIGFVNARDGVIMAYIDTTTGEFKSKGTIEGTTIKDTGQRVYSPVNKPTNNDLDLVSRRGDTLTGTYNLNKVTVKLSVDSKLIARDRDLINFDATKIYYGNVLDTLVFRSKDEPTIFVNGKEGKFYHTNNKPTKADVGLSRVTNDAQVKRAGDIMEGNLQAPRMLATNDPAGPNELVRLSYFEKKSMVANPTIIGNVDWNTLINRGIYRVENAGSGANKPAADYYYGVLVVYRPEDATGTRRIVQVYYPESDNHPVCWRSCSNDSWTAWNYMDNRKRADTRYVNVTGDTMSGALTVPAANGVRTAKANYNGDNCYAGLNGLNGTAMIHRISDLKAHEKLGITHDSKIIFVRSRNNTQDTDTFELYHEGHKPTPREVGAVPLNAVIDFGTF